MTGEERDELLIRMDERLQHMDLRLRIISRSIFGNGTRPGIAQRLQMLEDRQRSSVRHLGAIAAVAGFIINALIAACAVFWKN